MPLVTYPINLLPLDEQEPRYREEIVGIADKLRAEMDRVDQVRGLLQRGGADDSKLEAEVHGMFTAYKMLADVLGWQ